MYRKIKTFNGLSNYLNVSSCNTIVLFKVNMYIKSLNSINFKLNWELDNYYSVQLFKDNYVIIVDKKYDSEFVDSVSGEIDVKLKIKFGSKIFFDFFENFGIYIEKKSGGEIFGLYDFEDNRVLWELPYIRINIRIFQKNLIGSWHEGILNILNAQTGQTLWQYSISEIGKFQDNEGIWQEGKVERIVGVLDEVLVVVVKGVAGIGTHQLIGLDTNTGNLLWQLANYEYQGKTYEAISATAYFLMPTPDNQHVIGFSYGFYIKIDPKTGKIIRFKKLYEDTYIQWKDYEIKSRDIDSGSVVDNLIFFRTSTSKHSGFPNTIGAFNFHTEEIEWLHVFEEFSTNGRFLPNSQPKAEGNRVYALDSGNTLHIFEREY